MEKVYIREEERYGRKGYVYKYTYYSNAYDVYDACGWVEKEVLHKLFPQDRYEIVEKNGGLVI